MATFECQIGSFSHIGSILAKGQCKSKSAKSFEPKKNPRIDFLKAKQKSVLELGELISVVFSNIYKRISN